MMTARLTAGSPILMLKPLAVLALASAAGYANAAPNDLAGVWQGTLGKSPITA